MLYSNKQINELLETQVKLQAGKKFTKATKPNIEPAVLLQSITTSIAIPSQSESIQAIITAPVQEKQQLPVQQSSVQQQSEEEPEVRQSIATHKELRMKKYDLETKIKGDGETNRNEMIKTLMDQHQNMNNLIKSHYQKELMSQEDEFTRKMNERRERSLERSLVKGGSKRDMSKDTLSASKSDTGFTHLLSPTAIKLADKLLVPLTNGKQFVPKSNLPHS